MGRQLDTLEAEMDRLGFALLSGVFPVVTMDALVEQLTAALNAAAGEGSAMYGANGTVYAARNVLALWPPAASVWRQAPLPAVLATLLGTEYGLVRALFFDKPPDQTWSLPWHKDLTIAVRDNRLPSRHFQKPTTKAGVPHVEAPVDVLHAMVTMRIHLDDITEENGPLRVIAGSHRSGKALELANTHPQSILACRGDVLLMRPLLAHCSNRSQEGTRRHRRILHLEFATSPQLPDGYAWHHFVPGRAA
jgi:ectoine hydroxylase-related dioxygenase (phytanoyl-CoA dioxygenase family)